MRIKIIDVYDADKKYNLIDITHTGFWWPFGGTRIYLTDKEIDQLIKRLEKVRNEK